MGAGYKYKRDFTLRNPPTVFEFLFGFPPNFRYSCAILGEDMKKETADLDGGIAIFGQRFENYNHHNRDFFLLITWKLGEGLVKLLISGGIYQSSAYIHM